MSNDDGCKIRERCKYKEGCKNNKDVPISYKKFHLRKWSNINSRYRVGIICTIGPSVFTSEYDHQINKLIMNGMNIARINLSHYQIVKEKDEKGNRILKPLDEDIDRLVNTIKTIRRCSDKLQIPVNIMLDLKGPEIRVSHFLAPDLKKLAPATSLEIKEKDDFRFTIISGNPSYPIEVKNTVLALSMSENELINKFQEGSEYCLTIGEEMARKVKCEKRNENKSIDFKVTPEEGKRLKLEVQTKISISDNKVKVKKGAIIDSKITCIYKPVLHIAENDELILADKKILKDNKKRKPLFNEKDIPVILLDYDGNFDMDISIHNPEEPIYMDDGKASFRVTSGSKGTYNCTTVKVIYGETVELRKSMNLFNNARESAEEISDIDKIYLKEILTHPAFVNSCPIDSIAVSFVRSNTDLNMIDNMLNMFGVKEKKNWNIRLVAKIESPHCFMERDVLNPGWFNQKETNFTEYKKILNNKLCWAVMVARGDLGVEIKPEEVPEIQQMLTDEANIAGKGVIVATQMLLSMVNNNRPSRADVTDIHNAVLSGADVVMLSEETAKGKYPVESLRYMRTIIGKAVNNLLVPEKREVYVNKILKKEKEKEKEKERKTRQIMDLLGEPMVNISIKSGSPVIFSYALTGGTVTKIPKYRPDKPIIAITNSEMAAKNMLFYFGVFPLLIVEKEGNEDKADFDFPRDVKEYRDFIRAIVKTFREEKDIYFESLRDIKDGQVVFGLLGIDDKSSYLSDRAIVIFRM